MTAILRVHESDRSAEWLSDGAAHLRLRLCAGGTGAGYVVIWTEDGEEHQVGARLPLEDTLALAEDLDAVDLETFRERLEQQ